MDITLAQRVSLSRGMKSQSSNKWYHHGIHSYLPITTENYNGNASAGPSDRQINITGLTEYVAYNITMFASTVKGDGPHSTPSFIVRTYQDSK